MSKFYEAVNKMDPALADPCLTPAEEPPQSKPAAQTATAGSVSSTTPVFPAPSVIPVAPAAQNTYPDTGELYTFESRRNVSVKLAAGSPILPFEGADERAAERYRVIRTKLRQDPKKVICISSSSMGDGKSVNAINIAGVLALKHETRVLVVDGDFRRSTMATMLGLANTPGLSDVLAGIVDWRDAIMRIVEAPNLYFMPAGEQKLNPAELLDSTRWKTTCDMFRRHFSFVIIDSPPMGTVADYDLIQSVCDGVIVVARQDHSNRSRLVKAIESVPANKFMGVVMNCVSPWTLWRTHDDAADVYGYKPASK